jgi:hypothetical protein
VPLRRSGALFDTNGDFAVAVYPVKHCKIVKRERHIHVCWSKQLFFHGERLPMQTRGGRKLPDREVQCGLVTERHRHLVVLAAVSFAEARQRAA